MFYHSFIFLVYKQKLSIKLALVAEKKLCVKRQRYRIKYEEFVFGEFVNLVNIANKLIEMVEIFMTVFIKL